MDLVSDSNLTLHVEMIERFLHSDINLEVFVSLFEKLYTITEPVISDDAELMTRKLYALCRDYGHPSFSYSGADQDIISESSVLLPLLIEKLNFANRIR
jgi:hypothetical protein